MLRFSPLLFFLCCLGSLTLGRELKLWFCGIRVNPLSIGDEFDELEEVRDNLRIRKIFQIWMKLCQFVSHYFSNAGNCERKYPAMQRQGARTRQRLDHLCCVLIAEHAWRVVGAEIDLSEFFELQVE